MTEKASQGKDDLQAYLPIIRVTAERIQQRIKRQFLPYLLLTAFMGLATGFVAGRHFDARPTETPPFFPPSPAFNACPSTSSPTSAIREEIVVYVSGAVRFPHRVYTLPMGSLVQDAIRAAGGATDEANLDAINLAKPLYPHEQVIIPTVPVAVPPSTEATVTQDTGLLDLNSATAEQLEQLPGIGPTRAQEIITYRESHGPFTAVEDLLNVSGIGPATLDKLRPYVTVP